MINLRKPLKDIAIRWKRLLPQAACLLLLIAFLFPVSNMFFSSDSMGYVNKGTELAESFDYYDPTRGPGMPAITAIGIWVLGASATNLMVLVRIGYTVAVIAFAGLAWKLYGYRAGWAAVLYFAFAPLIHWPATRFHVDIFLIAGALLSLWALYEAHDRKSIGFAALSGVLVGLTFLTKETVILLFPLWLVAPLLFPPYDKRRVLVGAVSVLALLLTLLPWIAILHFIVGDVSLILGENVNESGTFSNFLERAFSGPVEFVSLMTAKFINFFRHYFTGETGEVVAGMGAYGWLLIVSLPLFLARTVVRRRRQDMFVAIAFLLYSPFMIYLGWATYDHRQSAIIFAIGAFAVAAVVQEAALLLSKWKEMERFRARTLRTAPALGVILIAGILAAVTPSFQGRFGGSYHAFTLYLPGRESFRPTGALSPNLVDAADWITRHAGRNAAVMTAHRRPSHYFEFVMDRPVTFSPIEKHNILTYLDGTAEPVAESGRPQGTAVFVQPNRAPNGLRECIYPDQDPLGPRFCKIYYLREDDLIAEIRESGAEYFVVTPRFRYFDAYLEQNPNFVRERDFGEDVANPNRQEMREGVTVYSIAKPEPVPGNLDVAVNYSLALSIEAFRSEHPEIYERWKDEVLFATFGLSQAQVDSILARETRCFTKDLHRPAFLDCLEADSRNES